jgi:hypothetical protein
MSDDFDFDPDGSLWDKIKEAFKIYEHVSAIVLPLLVVAKIPSGQAAIENPHADLIKRFHARYETAPLPRELIPVFVWRGQENPQGLEQYPLFPQTVWVWQWKDTFNLDVAVVMNIQDVGNEYHVFFQSFDVEQYEKFVVWIDGVEYHPISNPPTGIVMAK